MKRQVPGLADATRDSRPEVPDGIFLVRVDGALFRWHAQKPFYVLRLQILEPAALAHRSIVGRLYCTQKAMWKLGWFLRDFLYDPEMLAHEQIDEKALPGLRGVVKISHTMVNGISLVKLTWKWVRARESVGRTRGPVFYRFCPARNKFELQKLIP